MTEIGEAITPSPSTEQAEATAVPVPWYTLNPKHLHFSRFTWRLIAVAAVVIALVGFSVKPLWRLGWHERIYPFAEFSPAVSATGVRLPAGAWTHSKLILVYGAPEVLPRNVEAVAAGLRSLVEELGLDFEVRQVPLPPEALAALRAATRTRNRERGFDFDGFAARRLDDRAMQYGEMVVIADPFTDPDWAHGLSLFAPGIAVLQEIHADHSLGRHEGAHLLGYDKHDDFPWFVLGYREGLIPANRDTLMMLNVTASDALSPRASDALHSFWQGMERRDGVRYFTRHER